MATFKPGDKVKIKYSGKTGVVVTASESTVIVVGSFGRTFYLKPQDLRAV